jgi:hypothetical protein
MPVEVKGGGARALWWPGSRDSEDGGGVGARWFPCRSRKGEKWERRGPGSQRRVEEGVGNLVARA